MKILIISHMYPLSSSDVGGIFVHQQSKELKRQGCEIKVVSPVPWTPFPIKYLSKKWKKYSKIPLQVNHKKIEVYSPRYISFPRALFFASSGKKMYHGIKKIVAEIYKDFKFDVVHSHVALPDSYAGMIIAKKYRKPLIITIHGQDFQQTIHKNKECKKKIEEVINFSSKTIVVSDKLKRIGNKELNIGPKKLITIPNGINVEDMFKGKSDLIEKYKGKKIILSVSNLIKTKGIDYNLKAITELKKKYPEIIYLIVGDGSEKKNLENLTKELKMQDYVKFLGELSHNKVMEYMSICNIFSLPSWNEGFGIVYLEAMICAKPVIACQREGIDGIIKNKKTGLLVKPKNIDELIMAINFPLSFPKIAKEMGEMGEKMVLNNYAWTKVTKKIAEIYNNFLI